MFIQNFYTQFLQIFVFWV